MFRVTFLFALFVVLLSCEEKDSGIPGKETDNENKIDLPEVIISSVEDIKYTSAVIESIIISTGGATVESRGVGWSKKKDLPPEETIAATTVSGSGSFTASLNGLEENTRYYVWAYAGNSAGTAYSERESFITPETTGPEVLTVSVENILANSATIDCNVSGNGGLPVFSRGVYWSEHPDVAVADNKQEEGEGTGIYQVRLQGLQPNTTYYVRAYAENSKGVSYGEELSFTTNAKTGNLTYTLHKAVNPTAQQQEAYDLIKEAMDSAVWYYNHYTSLTKTINVYYEPSVPTADGNSNGTIRFGSTASMNKVTAMHEVAHTIGVGTTAAWQGLIVGGVYQGEYATQALREITGNPNDEIHGDGHHFWPYGLNYVHEYKSTADLINHCKIVNAMKQDGL